MDSSQESPYVMREWNDADLDKYLRNSDYVYEKDTRIKDNSLRNRIKNWLRSLFRTDVNIPEGTKAIRTIGSIAAILVSMILILSLAKFGRKASSIDSPDEFSMTTLDKTDVQKLEEAILKAREDQDFNRIVRLRFLLILKEMTDKNIIQWKRYKSNMDYMEELASTKMKSDFSRLMYWYEYSWYGNHEVNVELLRSADLDFDQFGESLQNEMA